MSWILNLIGPIVQLLNNIFSMFKKSATEKAEEENVKRQKEIDKEIEKAKHHPK